MLFIRLLALGRDEAEDMLQMVVQLERRGFALPTVGRVDGVGERSNRGIIVVLAGSSGLQHQAVEWQGWKAILAQLLLHWRGNFMINCQI